MLTRHTASASGQTVKKVECEQCQCRYTYLLKRKVFAKTNSVATIGMSRADDRASQKADAALAKQLSKQCDAVSCPACGWYQRNMVRRIKLRVIRWLAFSICVIPLILVMIAGTMWSNGSTLPDWGWILGLIVVILCLGAAIGVFFALNPNSSAARRVANGKAGNGRATRVA